MSRSVILLFLIYSISCFLSHKKNYPDLPTASIDFEKFMGRWYSIAHKPNLIEKFCKCTRTTDTLIEPMKIQLSESCKIFGMNITSVSYAIPEKEGSGKWTNVQPLGPFEVKGDYWVVDRDEEYKWAIIGQPSRKGFWILSRTLEFDDDLYHGLIQKGKAWGYDMSDLVREENKGCDL